MNAMELKFDGTEKALTESDIQRIETKYKLKLPKEYRDHLIKYNGGHPSPRNIYNYQQGDRQGRSDIDYFLAIYNGKYDNFEDTFETYKVDEIRMPDHIIPIANDSGGNVICISVGDKDYGHIYFWDHELEASNFGYEQPYYDNLFHIANSFNEFLDSLYEYQE